MFLSSHVSIKQKVLNHRAHGRRIPTDQFTHIFVHLWKQKGEITANRTPQWPLDIPDFSIAYIGRGPGKLNRVYIQILVTADSLNHWVPADPNGGRCDLEHAYTWGSSDGPPDYQPRGAFQVPTGR